MGFESPSRHTVSSPPPPILLSGRKRPPPLLDLGIDSDHESTTKPKPVPRMEHKKGETAAPAKEAEPLTIVPKKRICSSFAVRMFVLTCVTWMACIGVLL